MTEFLDPTDRIITLFGGSGFIGRHLVRALARDGWRVRVATRRPDLAFHLQPLGRVGQIHAVQANVRYPDSLAQALRGADAAVNLVGILAPWGKQTFDSVQAEGSAVVALAVNFCAFCVWLLPGVNALVFFVANAYLFSREYFQLAALRFRPLDEVVELRRRHRLTLFAAGLIIALFVVTPVLNLLTPLFGIALMARLHKRLAPPLIPAPQQAVVRQAF